MDNKVKGLTAQVNDLTREIDQLKKTIHSMGYFIQHQMGTTNVFSSNKSIGWVKGTTNDKKAVTVQLGDDVWIQRKL